MSKNKMAKKVLASSAALCLVLSSTSFAASAATIAPEKLGGDNRFDTAIKIAEASWKDAWKGSTNAILASGNQANLVDALAVAPLAYELKAPILLDDANKDVVNEDTLKALKDNGVKKVYIATGTGVISEKAEAQLKEAGMEVVRLGGASRYDTAENILDEFKKNGGKVDTVALVAGTGLADALSVAPVAAKQGMPILLTNGKDKVAANLEDVAKAAKKIYAVGGDGIIADALVKDLKAERLGGANRFDTNAAVVKAFAKDGKVKFDKVYFAEGINGLVDALTGSVLAAQSDAPVVLTNNKLDKMADTKAMLKENVTDKTELNAFGKTVVEDSFLEDVKNVKNEGEDGEVKVDSVSALNLKQIKITFTGSVKEADATDVDNYDLDDTDAKIQKAEMDGKNAVILTLADDIDKEGKNVEVKEYPVSNQDEVKVTVDKILLDSDKDFEKTIKMEDTTLPEVEDVKVVGIRTIKVSFSESVQPKKADTHKENKKLIIDKLYADSDAFQVNEKDGRKLHIKDVQLVNNNTEANIQVSTELDEMKAVEVKVKAGIEDYAGYGVVGKSVTADVDKDEEAPYVVAAKDVSTDKVTLVFNEDVEAEGTLSKKGTDDKTRYEDFYHTNSKNKASNVEINGKEVTLSFAEDEELPDGISYIHINSEALHDLWENKNDNITYKVENEKDDIKPTIDKVEQGDTEKEIIVKFSENVDEDSAEDKDNYVLKDSKDKEVKFRRPELTDDDEVTIRTNDDLDGDYTLTVKDVEDKAGNKMEKEEKEFTMKDSTAPELKSDDVTLHYYKPGTEDQVIVIDFGEDMLNDGSRYAVDNIDNYELVLGDDKPIKLADITDAKINIISNQKIEIELPYDDDDPEDDTYDLTDKDVKLNIARVKDAAGNETDSIATTELEVKKEGNLAFDTKPEATKTDEIQFVLKDDVDFDEADVKVVVDEDGDGKYDTDEKLLVDPADDKNYYDCKTKVNDDGNTVVTYTLDSDNDTIGELNYDGTYGEDSKNVLVAFVGDKSEDEYGSNFEKQDLKVADSIAPELDEFGKGAKDSTGDSIKGEDMVESGFNKDGKPIVKLTFTEAIDEGSVSSTTFEVDDFDVIDVDVDDKVITLILDDDKAPQEGTSVIQKSPIKDKHDDKTTENEAKDISTEVFKDNSKADKEAAKKEAEAAKKAEELKTAKTALEAARATTKGYEKVESVKTALAMPEGNLEEIKAKTTAITEAVTAAKASVKPITE